MKELKDMTPKEFFSLLKKNLDNKILDKLIKEYEENYQKIERVIVSGYELLGGYKRGRTDLEYFRSLTYGWLIEEAFEYILKAKGLNVEKYGTDNLHKFHIDPTLKFVKVIGAYTTEPDFKLKLNDSYILIEVMTGARGKFTIKEGKVKKSFKNLIISKIPTIFVMIDATNLMFSSRSILDFISETPKPNPSMEGKMCFDFITPNKPLKEISNKNFSLNISNLSAVLKISEKLSDLVIPKEIKKVSSICWEYIMSRNKAKFYTSKKEKIKKDNPDLEEIWTMLDDL